MTEIPSTLPVPARMLERQRDVLVTHVAGARRRRAQRRVAVAAVVVVLLAALVAGPALGLGSRLAELFEGTPAPPPVQESFTGTDAMLKRFIAAGFHDRYSRIVAEEAHGLVSLETPDGPIHLWVAPTEDGRQCSFVQMDTSASGRPLGGSTCDGLETRGMTLSSPWWRDSRPSVRVVHVRVYDEDIVRVDVHVTDGGVVQLPVVAGHAFGALDPSAHLDHVVGFDADGDEVDRLTWD